MVDLAKQCMRICKWKYTAQLRVLRQLCRALLMSPAINQIMTPVKQIRSQIPSKWSVWTLTLILVLWVIWTKKLHCDSLKTWQYICDHKSGKSWWILIIFTYVKTENGPLQVSYLLIYFTCDVNVASLSLSWHWWAATASAACVARLGAVADWWQLTNGQHACVLVFVPMVDILRIPCGLSVCFCQFVFSVLDELYVSHTTLDALGNYPKSTL